MFLYKFLAFQSSTNEVSIFPEHEVASLSDRFPTIRDEVSKRRKPITLATHQVPEEQTPKYTPLHPQYYCQRLKV